MLNSKLNPSLWSVTDRDEAASVVCKETFYSVKRDLLQCQKRPTNTGVH
jgi:hypothetical protein